MILLLGAHGQLGSALLRQLEISSSKVMTLSWADSGNLTTAQLRGKLVEMGTFEGPCDFIFANGLTNPTTPAELLLESNLRFPERVVEASRDNQGLRYLTFGTVFENFPEACAHNPYLKSKFELGNWMQSQAKSDPRFSHVRLHTLYGGNLVPHLFLGQIMTAIRMGTEFKMTQGDQIREYHHVDDIAVAIIKLLERRPGAVTQLNSGKPLPLHQIAREVFAAFEKSELLKIGAIESPRGENTDRVFPASELLTHSQDALQGIILWLKQGLKSGTKTTEAVK